jgi:hypothetical protein
MQLPVVEIFAEMFLHFSKILFAQTLSLPGKVRDAGKLPGAQDLTLGDVVLLHQIGYGRPRFSQHPWLL